MFIKQKVKYPIDLKRTALVIVDMQNLFCEPDGSLYVESTQDIMENVKNVTDAAHRAGMPVIYLSHIVRGDGSDTGRFKDMYPKADEQFKAGTYDVEITDQLTVEPSDIKISKLFYSGFHNTDLDAILRLRDIDTIIICGTVTNVCCETTVRDAVHREYKVIFLSDGNAAMDYPDMGWGEITAEEIQKVTLTVLSYEFCQVSTTEEVVKEINAKITKADKSRVL
ncbi:isochorismatase family cysteine hydrolase [Bacillus sp. B15-48]|uniref:cysteine hydrolase family protein n=1 Tax=Bacillus sp. B15-48 TaxID=1548601 RepID=UPI00193FBC67|nr:isochorismatase family cysteine hydrolase [Bacillus sp. B15-48]